MTIDWHKGYGVSFEFWKVNPLTYKNERLIRTAESCSITRDSALETLGNASLAVADKLESECWIRVYLIASQFGVSYRECLGTFLAVTPSVTMNGTLQEYSIDLHTPLKELADDGPRDGYPIPKGANAIREVWSLFSRSRVAVDSNTGTATMPRQVAAMNDSWLSLAKKALAEVQKELRLDAYGLVSIAPLANASQLAPVWTFADDETSIINSKAELTCDWGEIPNEVRVVLSDSRSDKVLYASACNLSEKSPVSIPSRGRIVSLIEENPEGIEFPDVLDESTLEALQIRLNEYAKRRLKELSNTERRITFTHGYCPVRLGDCIRIRRMANGLDIKAKVVKQVIDCSTDLTVTTEAVYTEGVWDE